MQTFADVNRRRDDAPVILEVFWRARAPERYRHSDIDSALSAAHQLARWGIGSAISADDGAHCYGDDE